MNIDKELAFERLKKMKVYVKSTKNQKVFTS